MRRPLTGRIFRWPARLLIAVALFAGHIVDLGGAAAQIYDMGPMLNEPHPFEVAPPPQLRPSSRPGFSGRLYDMGPLLDEPHPFDVQPPDTSRPLLPSDRQTRPYPQSSQFRNR